MSVQAPPSPGSSGSRSSRSRRLKASALHVDFARLSVAEAMARAVPLYREHGCFLARGLLGPEDLAPLRDYVRELSAELWREVGRTPSPESDGETRFDDGVAELAGVDRSLVGRLFDAGRRLLPLHQLSVHPRLVQMAHWLIDSDLIAASDVKALRIDLPHEEKYLFDWHQDFPYVMDSPDAVVFWIPLQDVDATNGSLSVAPGSHREGVQRLTLHDPHNAGDNKQRLMSLADRSVLERHPSVRVPARAGDVLVFHTLLLHASGANRSPRPRFTAQVRFGNFRDPVAIEKGWPGSMRDGSVFHQLFPEHVVG